MTALTCFSFPSAGDGYSAYARAVAAIPPLDAAEERRLADDYRQKNDLAAARQLAVAHLRLVVSVARGYNGYGLEQGDLVQEGNIGLLKAVQKFDPDRGARLATFAVYWIRAEIHNFILRNWRIVKIATTKAQRKLFFHMRRLFEKSASGNLHDAETVAQDLGVRAKDVDSMRARVRNTACIPYSSEQNGEPAGAEIFLQAAESSDPESALLLQKNGEDAARQVSESLESLNPRAREIIESRLMRETPATLQTLAAKFNISAERVRQLEAQALKKLRAHLGAV